MYKIFTIHFFFAVIVFFFPAQAYAYIDPGVGSMLLQGAAAALLAGLVFFQSLRAKIINFFRKGHGGQENKDSVQEPEDK